MMLSLKTGVYVPAVRKYSNKNKLFLKLIFGWHLARMKRAGSISGSVIQCHWSEHRLYEIGTIRYRKQYFGPGSARFYIKMAFFDLVPAFGLNYIVGFGSFYVKFCGVFFGGGGWRRKFAGFRECGSREEKFFWIQWEITLLRKRQLPIGSFCPAASDRYYGTICSIFSLLLLFFLVLHIHLRILFLLIHLFLIAFREGEVPLEIRIEMRTLDCPNKPCYQLLPCALRARLGTYRYLL